MQVKAHRKIQSNAQIDIYVNLILHLVVIFLLRMGMLPLWVNEELVWFWVSGSFENWFLCMAFQWLGDTAINQKTKEKFPKCTLGYFIGVDGLKPSITIHDFYIGDLFSQHWPHVSFYKLLISKRKLSHHTQFLLYFHIIFNMTRGPCFTHLHSCQRLDM